MKISQTLFLLLIFSGIFANQKITKRISEYLKNKHSDESKLRLLIESGKIDGFFGTTEINDIFEHLTKKYASFVRSEKIGSSFQERKISAYHLHSSKNSKVEKSKVLFTGLHHARELITANMIVKIFIETLHSLIHDTDRFTFWNYCDLVIIPVVNVDSHFLISESFGKSDFSDFKEKRKNMNSQVCKDGSLVNQGVDLNRNYGFHYGEDSGDNEECSETFRGVNAFSEPETRAVRDFLEKEKSVVSAMNFHSYGNMWIHPFNYMKIKHKFPETTLQGIVHFYEKFGKEVGEVSKSEYGNAIETVNYSTDGEASDWMLGEHGIISFSPELGSFNPKAQDFIIPKNLIYDVIQENFKVINLFLEKNSVVIKDVVYGFDNNGVFSLSFTNAGLANIYQPVLKIEQSAKSNSFINGVGEVHVETGVLGFKNVKLEINEGSLTVAIAKINRLDNFRVQFKFNDKKIEQNGFELKIELKMHGGYKIETFDVVHLGIKKDKTTAFILLGGTAGATIVILTIALWRLLACLTKKDKGSIGKELVN